MTPLARRMLMHIVLVLLVLVLGFAAGVVVARLQQGLSRISPGGPCMGAYVSRAARPS